MSRVSVVLALAALALVGCAPGRADPRVAGRVIERSPQPRVTHVTPLAGEVAFVAQSVSFSSWTAGRAVSRRPAVHDPERPADGVAPGREWHLLWLRAVNCEGEPRSIDFAVVDATGREVSVVTARRNVAAGASHAWIAPAEGAVVVAAGQSVAARWYGMGGTGAPGCNWQYGALEAPEGRPPALSRGRVDAVRGSFAVRRPGLHASWRSRPAAGWFEPVDLTATNCEPGARRLEAVLLSPDRLVFGELPGRSQWAGATPGDGTLHWSGPSGLVLPPGWSIGVRWHGMSGDGDTCRWSGHLRAITPQN